MRVHELVEELSEYDPDAILVCHYDDVLGTKKTEIGQVEILVPERELVDVEW